MQTTIVKLFAALLLALGVAACTKPVRDFSDDQVAAAFYKSPDAPKLTLMTSINVRSKEGAHSALLISADQRVIWDPAGGFSPDEVVEKGDVLYGVTPHILKRYQRFQSNDVFYLVMQDIPVSAEVAQRALQLAQSYGNVPDAQCALSTSRILQQLPGFEHIKTGWFPLKLRAQIAKMPNVTERAYKTDENWVIHPFTPPAE